MPIRCTEWSRVTHRDLTADVRQGIAAAADSWRSLNGLALAPLYFSGPDGVQLCTRQYVGVVEVGDVTVEIYPKLDSALIDSYGTQPPPGSIETTMSNLFWMLEESEHRNLIESSTAHLEESPTSFFDLFAFLLGKHLLPELEHGVAHSYVPLQGDLRSVRGRIGLVEQVTRHWNRFDKVFCSWDEFTSNTALNRLFKCACRFLSTRVRYLQASHLLMNCETLLDEVEDVHPSTALRDVENLRFDRPLQRYRLAFDLSKRLLSGIGHNLGAGEANTFVFLIDMNKLFENYVRAVLQSHFKTAIEDQKYVGSLLRVQPGSMFQKADYFWTQGTTCWIGDAKYKHLAKGQLQSLRFSDVEKNDRNDSALAGRVLNSDDVRQLTVYAELLRSRARLAAPPHLMLLYPFIGPQEKCQVDKTIAWNGSVFWLMPVQVRRLKSISEAIYLG
jgi:5-methylcytosine-specific restriction endonuclease McrBC regulatory subunit McrC